MVYLFIYLFILVIGFKEKNSLLIFAQRRNISPKTDSQKSIFTSQTFTSWNTAVPFSLNTFDLPQTLQLKSLIT